MQIIKKFFFPLFVFSTMTLMGESLSEGELSMMEANYSQGLPWVTRYEEAVQLGKESNKPILILFTGTTWCPACRVLEREVLTHPQFIKDVSQKFIFLKIEFTSAPSASPLKALADRYGVRVYPTIVVINPDGTRLFVVNYKQGRAGEYSRELLGQLQTRNQKNLPAQSVQPVSPTSSLNSLKDTQYKKDPKMDDQGYYIP